MKLALSGRLWETAQGYTATFREQIQIAADLRYEGIELRYPLIPAAHELDAVRDELQQKNIQLVFAPAAGVPEADEQKTDLIRVLDALRHLGGRYLKLIPRSEADHDAMRLTADLAAERGIKAVTQLHSNSLTDTIERTERFLRTLDHPNMGLIFDACHIPFSEEMDIETAVQRLSPWIDLANMQSYKPASEGDGLQRHTINERDWVLALPDDPAGTDLAASVRALRAHGFDGWLTVMPAVDPSMEPVSVARAYRDFLTPLIS